MRFSGRVTVSVPLIFGNFLRGIRKNGLFLGAVMVLLIFSSKGNSHLTSSKGGVAIKWNGQVVGGQEGGGGAGKGRRGKHEQNPYLTEKRSLFQNVCCLIVTTFHFTYNSEI